MNRARLQRDAKDLYCLAKIVLGVWMIGARLSTVIAWKAGKLVWEQRIRFLESNPSSTSALSTYKPWPTYMASGPPKKAIPSTATSSSSASPTDSRTEA